MLIVNVGMLLLVGFVILLVVLSIRYGWRGRFLSEFNAFRIVDYFGGEIKVNEYSKLTILKSAHHYRPGIPEEVEFIFICNGKVLEEITCNLMKTKRHQNNIDFSKPWRYDIENALNDSMLAMNKETKRRESTTRECERKFYEESTRN